MPILVEPVHNINECRLIEALQLKIWESTPLEVVPDHLLWTMAKEGGLVLLARTEVHTPVGFAFGFLSRTDTGQLKLASHQVGVLPGAQNESIGYQLKLAQRDWALAQGLDLITWTFDPLQSRNAYLNLRKLAGVCATYFRTLYGEMRDELNQGLPSDRFRVDWWVATDRVARRLAGQSSSAVGADSPLLNPTTLVNGLPHPPPAFALGDELYYRVEIPPDINDLKAIAPALALAWRLQTRALFEAAFTAGYTVVDLLRAGDRNFYLLQKEHLP